MKNSRVFLYCFFVSVAISTGTYFAVNRQSKDVAVIDAVRLVDSFSMKKELEGFVKLELQKKNKVLDSMLNEVQLANGLHNDKDAKINVYTYDKLKSDMEEYYARNNEDINIQVWKRLNPLLNEFGKKTGHHLIIGANGMGTVLFVDQYYDVTNEAIKYVNEKYDEGN